MLPILLLSCAKTSVSTVQPKSSVEVLQTIDLRTEFSELNDTEWVYELLRWTVPSQQTLELNSNSGWKILDGEWDVDRMLAGCC